MNPDGCPDPSYGVVDDLGPNGWGAIILLEVGRAREYPNNYSNRPISRAWTGAHEVGHLFSGQHSDLGIMGGPLASSNFSSASLRPYPFVLSAYLHIPERASMKEQK